MTNVFMIGDTHFQHRKILEFERSYRRFDTIEEHDERLISNWNSVVRPLDVVWHLGDVTWNRTGLDLLRRLNGRKYLILGNHDNDIPTARWLEVFNRVSAAEEFDGGVLTHIPIHPYQQYRFKRNIHGHLHHQLVMMNIAGTDVPDPFYWNVSCEQINLTPIAYEDLKKRHSTHAE